LSFTNAKIDGKERQKKHQFGSAYHDAGEQDKNNCAEVN